MAPASPRPHGPEVDLLLLAARPGPPGDGAEALRAAAAALPDWTRLLALAARHGLLPRLHQSLAQAGAEVPRPAFVELWACHEALKRRNEAMAEALVEVLDLLEAAGIPALPFKGPALAMALHGDLALREFVDLDILVPRPQLSAAKSRLAESGWVPGEPLPPAQEAAMLRSRSQYHLLLVHPARAFAVELHWKTDPDHPVEAGTEAWWEACPRTDFLGRPIRAFTPPELALLLAVHGSKHRWERLAWLQDLALLAYRHPGLDWEGVRDKARSQSATRRLALGLHLAEEWLAAPLPGRLGSWAAEVPGVRGLAARIAETMGQADPSRPSAFLRLALDLQLIDTVQGKIAYAGRTLFAPSPEEWTAWPLPRWLGWLYPFLRAGRLVGKRLAS